MRTICGWAAIWDSTNLCWARKRVGLSRKGLSVINDDLGVVAEHGFDLLARLFFDLLLSLIDYFSDLCKSRIQRPASD